MVANCSACSHNLLESELFGHEQGILHRRRPAEDGRFELAHGGTIFLDEIGEISPPTQILLFEFSRIIAFEGGVRWKEHGHGDVRSDRSDPQESRGGDEERGFSGRSLLSLECHTAFVPPLRERKDDVLPPGIALPGEVQPGKGKGVQTYSLLRVLRCLRPHLAWKCTEALRMPLNMQSLLPRRLILPRDLPQSFTREPEPAV